MKVLLSIKPEFVQKIFDGSKHYEYRKNIFARKEISTIVVYSTQPVGKIVGEFDIERIICDTPYNVWQQTRRFAGITYSFYKEYFNERERAIAIKIGAVRRYDNPLNPREIFANFTAPQSFVYIRSEDYCQKT